MKEFRESAQFSHLKSAKSVKIMTYSNSVIFSRISWALVIAALLIPTGESRSVRDGTFFNPIVDFYSPDPYATKMNGTYWMVLANDWDITVYKNDKLHDFRDAERSVVFRPEPGFFSVWAPEIHHIDGEWYIYFAMAGGGLSHRMYVIKADDPQNPLGTWGKPVRMLLDAVNDVWAIDATVLQYGNGKKYLLWSAWPREDPAYPSNGSLYIAELENPFKIRGERTLLKEPRESWESGITDGDRICLVNEAPQILQRGDTTFVIFSANGAWLPNYCLGLMGIDGLRDPLIPANWWVKADGPVFWRNDEESVYTTGHCSVTTSPDDSETWMIYHGTDRILPPGEHHSIRNSRAQKITWGWDGMPVFPRPTGFHTPNPLPSGSN